MPADANTLIHRAQQGDQAAFAALYREHVGRVYALCLRLTADPARAEELTQDAFVRAWERLASFRGESAFSSWLYRLTVNVVWLDLRTTPRGVRERAAVAAHLAGCAACRAALAELRGLVANAHALPQRIEPPRELWTGIAARITERPPARGTVWWRERAFWAGVSAAAATLVLVLGVHRLTGPARPSGPVEGWGVVAADYQRATAELARTLAAERHRLRPETVALVERNLALIDAALGEARAALAEDPGNADLQP